MRGRFQVDAAAELADGTENNATLTANRGFGQISWLETCLQAAACVTVTVCVCVFLTCARVVWNGTRQKKKSKDLELNFHHELFQARIFNVVFSFLKNVSSSFH